MNRYSILFVLAILVFSSSVLAGSMELPDITNGIIKGVEEAKSIFITFLALAISFLVIGMVIQYVANFMKEWLIQITIINVVLCILVIGIKIAVTPMEGIEGLLIGIGHVVYFVAWIVGGLLGGKIGNYHRSEAYR